MAKKPWRCPDWPELMKALDRATDGAVLKRTPKRYREAVARALAVAKWSPEQPRSHRGTSYCGLCQINQYDGQDGCDSCALARVPQGRCCHPRSLYYYASVERDTGCLYPGAMDRLYNVLVQLYREEFERVCGGDA